MTALFVLAVVLAVAPAPPAANAPLPQAPAAVARSFDETSAALDGAIDAWRTSHGAAIPTDLTLYALFQQRLLRLLASRPSLARETLPLISARRAAFARDVVAAHRELVKITPPLRRPRIRVGPAAPADNLLRWYREGQRRFGVPWNVLAALNFVESAFGKLRSVSAAGAQGPMQFMPSSWRTYGLGGDVHDPHDAIVGAANYLHAAGSRSNLRRALHAYNPSSLYVDAVLRYARRIGADGRTFFELYSWQVYVRTRSGVRRVTGPGLQSGHSPTR